MPRALVIFESMYGNNQQVASAIVEGLRAGGAAVDLIEVGDAPVTVPADVALLVVGGPNHAAGMSRRSTRASAAERSGKPTITGETGLREWFDNLEQTSADVPAVAYDTRLAKPRFLRWFDRASRGIEKRLRKAGFHLVASPEHFYVTSEQGPLADGALDHAREWGDALSSYVGSAEPVP